MASRRYFHFLPSHFWSNFIEVMVYFKSNLILTFILFWLIQINNSAALLIVQFHIHAHVHVLYVICTCDLSLCIIVSNMILKSCTLKLFKHCFEVILLCC